MAEHSIFMAAQTKDSVSPKTSVRRPYSGVKVEICSASLRMGFVQIGWVLLIRVLQFLLRVDKLQTSECLCFPSSAEELNGQSISGKFPLHCALETWQGYRPHSIPEESLSR